MAFTCFRRVNGFAYQLRSVVRWNYGGINNTVNNSRCNSTAPEEQNKNASSVETTQSEPKTSAEMEKLTKEVTCLKEKIVDLDDKYKRSLADSENLRKRLTKQIEDAKIFGIQGFCKDLLDVADTLQKATESVPSEQIATNVHLKGLYEGLTMTEAVLHKVFKRHGLAQINPVGEKFDPNQHEALFEQPLEGKTSGTVIVVTKVGYKLHDRTIRPALVGVAK